MKRSTSFPLQPKSATEIGRRLVQQNVEGDEIKNGMYQMKLSKPRILDHVIATRGVSHGICNYICMYIDAVAKNDFYNIIFKINVNDT
jgi:hypothetical protein